MRRACSNPSSRRRLIICCGRARSWKSSGLRQPFRYRKKPHPIPRASPATSATRADRRTSNGPAPARSASTAALPPAGAREHIPRVTAAYGPHYPKAARSASQPGRREDYRPVGRTPAASPLEPRSLDHRLRPRFTRFAKRPKRRGVESSSGLQGSDGPARRPASSGVAAQETAPPVAAPRAVAGCHSRNR
jgi:hypothetical protein